MKLKKPLVASMAVLAVLGIGYWYANRSVPESRDPGTPHPPIQAMDQIADDPAALEDALRKNPTHTPVLLRMGQLALERGEPDTATRYFEEAVAVDSGNLDARLELGRALYESGRIEDALRATEAILEQDPRHVDALYNLGAMHANRGEPGVAAEYWRRAEATAPESESGRRAIQSLAVLAGGSRPVPEQAATPTSTGRLDSETERLILDISRRSGR